MYIVAIMAMNSQLRMTYQATELDWEENLISTVA